MKKNLALLVAVLMIMVLVSTITLADEGYEYINENGILVTGQSATLITDATSPVLTLGSGWYAVVGTLDRGTIVVNGDVNLILVNGCKLNVTGNEGDAGIRVLPGPNKNLNIYGQTGDAGTLNTTGGTGGAGIGGGGRIGHPNTRIDSTCGTIAISGGTINAEGNSGGAGIGGGGSGVDGSGGNITINGGKVNATGHALGAGIGGGTGNSGGNITINGGEVNAMGSAAYTGGSAGIGGGGGGTGIKNNGGTILISGGTVNAKGGVISYRGGSGIGGGNGVSGGGDITIVGGAVNAEGVGGGAGIGGGETGPGGSITISGGVIHATATGINSGGAGIGGGAFGDGGTVRLSGGVVFARSGSLWNLNGTDNQMDVGHGANSTSDGTLEISGTAVLFLYKNFCVAEPIITTHVRKTYTNHTVAEAETGYTVPLDWQVEFGVFLPLYTLTFANGYDNIPIATITQNYGTAITAPADPTREGYSFTGWDKEMPATMPLGGDTITAQWEVPNLPESSHTIASCGSATISLRNVSPWIYPMSVEIDGVHSYGPVVDNRTDELLNGPQKDVTGIRTITFLPNTGVHDIRYRVQAGSERDLYVGLPVGEWTEFSVESAYTISFDSDGGSSVAGITQCKGTAVTAPDDPTKAGYTFNGWEPSVPDTMPVGGAALTAQWELNEYTITFDSDGGSAVADITQDYGTAVTAPDDPTKAGYTFKGWEPSVPDTMPVGGAALTAQWIKIPATTDPTEPADPVIPTGESMSWLIYVGLFLIAGAMLLIVSTKLTKKCKDFS